MTRVSENSSHASLGYTLKKTKKRLEDLQLKGSTLRKISKPSDDPLASIESLNISSRLNNNKQFQQNSDSALLQLNMTEKAIEAISDIVMRAKELAVGQASDLYNPEVRKNIAYEIKQLKNQALAIGNKRVGSRYLFSGFKSLTPAFDETGNFQGDKGKVTLEIAKDHFVPINIDGHEIFNGTGAYKDMPAKPIEDVRGKNFEQAPAQFEQRELADTNAYGEKILDKNPYGEDVFRKEPSAYRGRSIASVDPIEQTIIAKEEAQFSAGDGIFSQLDEFVAALETNDGTMVQGLLERFDDSMNRLTTLRTKVGSLTQSVMTTKNIMESDDIDSRERRSKLIDADVTELFSDITKQQQILQSTYQASKGLINHTLFDFIK